MNETAFPAEAGTHARNGELLTSGSRLPPGMRPYML